MQMIYKEEAQRAKEREEQQVRWMSYCSKPSFLIIFPESSGSSNDGADTKDGKGNRTTGEERYCFPRSP